MCVWALILYTSYRYMAIVGSLYIYFVRQFSLPVIYFIFENTMFQKIDPFPSSGIWQNGTLDPTQLGL
jgi:hypothetical protein